MVWVDRWVGDAGRVRHKSKIGYHLFGWTGRTRGKHMKVEK